MHQLHPVQDPRAGDHHPGPRLVFQQPPSYRRERAEGAEPVQPAEDLPQTLQHPSRHRTVLRGHHQPGGARPQLQPPADHTQGDDDD